MPTISTMSLMLRFDVEKTRDFAATLRPSCDKRWWTARYDNAPK